MLTVESLLKDDRWRLVELEHPNCPALIRFRTPVLGPAGVEGYEPLLAVLWAYAPEESGAMPDPGTAEEMGRFEGHLCEAVERDAHAVLTAVLTFDGARQWVFYTRVVPEFGRRLGAIPDYHGAPYPIELTTDDDPTWAYLREQILRRVPTGE